jgi:hypothetical protein
MTIFIELYPLAGQNSHDHLVSKCGPAEWPSREKLTGRRYVLVSDRRGVITVATHHVGSNTVASCQDQPRNQNRHPPLDGREYLDWYGADLVWREDFRRIDFRTLA